MRIKEGDKWKVAFTISEVLFEPTVIFFRLTNSLATFQTMINEILRDLINTGKAKIFIDNIINNIIVETESEERYDEFVEKILKKMEEKDLYIKLEKCRQKIRKWNFWEV